MKILVLNCGSSSIKYKLYHKDSLDVCAEGIVERIGLDGSFLKHKAQGKTVQRKEKFPDHDHALQVLLNELLHGEAAVIKSAEEICAVGHRVVHGGELFTGSVLINKAVIKAIAELSPLSPLHNPANLAGIRAASDYVKSAAQVAVFDTAFHQSLPPEAYHYAIPAEWYETYRVRKYGFHGTSHLYVSKRAAVMLGKPASECNLITLHIGNGVSCTAIKGGLSVDTSMGMTPLEGAIMGTRTGDIDPAVSFYIMGETDARASQVYDVMNKKSGLLGITGRFSDRRDIIENAPHDERCALALKMETYRLKQYIGRYMATLGRVDAVVFTAGVGENSPVIRELTVSGLEQFGIIIDEAKNNEASGETDISSASSPVKIFMIPTNEEQVLVEDVRAVLDGTYRDHMHYKYSFTQ